MAEDPGENPCGILDQPREVSDGKESCRNFQES